MSSEPQFLSFKGLKHYTPEGGWTEFGTAPRMADKASPPPAPEIPTLTETPGTETSQGPVVDPLINELFDQLKSPPSDDLTQTWRTISAEVNLLSQRMAMRRELQDRIAQLDRDMAELRETILIHLRDAQHAADQQLSSAQLRAEVSALAKHKLAAKLAGDS